MPLLNILPGAGRCQSSVPPTQARRFSRWLRALAALLLGGALVAPAAASGVAQLESFLRDTRAARGQFEQQVFGAAGKAPQRSKGRFALQRPGRFRWSYEQPYAQLLVSDGKTFWSYDPELRQVVTRPIGKALTGSPAELLAGVEFTRHFSVREDGSGDGLEFVEATPRNDESGFARLRIGLAGNLPVRMELFDSFGQVTRLQFGHIEANPVLSAELFRFTPPSGVDVLRNE